MRVVVRKYKDSAQVIEVGWAKSHTSTYKLRSCEVIAFIEEGRFANQKNPLWEGDRVQIK